MKVPSQKKGGAGTSPLCNLNYPASTAGTSAGVNIPVCHTITNTTTTTTAHSHLFLSILIPLYKRKGRHKAAHFCICLFK
jgi:hypothetical protein|tara:strand:- start:243 stop:482 length:240 start_codon:yes stop_codon:yes gene_type:complete